MRDARKLMSFDALLNLGDNIGKVLSPMQARQEHAGRLAAMASAILNVILECTPVGWTGVMPFNWPSAGRVPLQT